MTVCPSETKESNNISLLLFPRKWPRDDVSWSRNRGGLRVSILWSLQTHPAPICDVFCSVTPKLHPPPILKGPLTSLVIFIAGTVRKSDPRWRMRTLHYQPLRDWPSCCTYMFSGCYFVSFKSDMSSVWGVLGYLKQSADISVLRCVGICFQSFFFIIYGQVDSVKSFESVERVPLFPPVPRNQHDHYLYQFPYSSVCSFRHLIIWSFGCNWLTFSSIRVYLRYIW